MEWVWSVVMMSLAEVREWGSLVEWVWPVVMMSLAEGREWGSLGQMWGRDL